VNKQERYHKQQQKTPYQYNMEKNINNLSPDDLSRLFLNTDNNQTLCIKKRRGEISQVKMINPNLKKQTSHTT